METINRIVLDAGADITLQIDQASPSDRFILKGVEGLGAPDVDVAISNGFYQGRKTLDREIEFKVGLNPVYSEGERPANLREEIYGLLTPYADYDYVNITLYGSTKSYYTKGWVRRCVPVPFSKDPEVMVTLATEKPYFVSADVSTSLVGLNKSLFTIMNGGSARTGFRFKLYFTQNANEFRITNAWGDRKMVIPYAFQVADELTIKTDVSERGIFHFRPSTDKITELSGLLTSDSEWIQLGYRENIFIGSNVNAWTPIFINHTPRHWGI